MFPRLSILGHREYCCSRILYVCPDTEDARPADGIASSTLLRIESGASGFHEKRAMHCIVKIVMLRLSAHAGVRLSTQP